MRRLGRVAAAALACLLVALCGGGAFAHSVLLGTQPAGEEILDRRPESVRLLFNEPVTPVVARVLDRTGKAITDTADVGTVDAAVEIRLPSDLAEGPYIVTWRVVSADSHPIGGSFRFSVGNAGEPAAIDDPGLRETVWETASILNRALFYGSALAACGGALFLLIFQKRGVGGATTGDLSRLVAFAFVPTALSLPIEGGRLFAAEISSFADPALWTAAIASTMGRSVLVATIGLLLLLTGLRFGDRLPGRLLIIAGALTTISSLALTGHAATAAPRALMSWTVFAHALAVAFWFGALWPLLTALRRLSPPDAADLMNRFSDVALAVVGLLVAAGTTLAIVQVATPAGLIETSYGRVFLVKLGLVVTVLLVALANRQRLTPRLASGEERARRLLDRNIRIEIGVIATGLVVTSVLGHVTPPRALVAMGQSPEAHAHSHAGSRDSNHGTAHSHTPEPSATEAVPLAWTATSRGYTAEIGLASRSAGRNTLAVTVRTPSGEEVSPIEVKARFALPEKGIEPSIRKLERQGDAWRVETTDLALPGRWAIRVDVLVSDFEKVMFETNAVLR